MGAVSGAPINELVGVLSLLEQSQIDALRLEFPELAAELRRGQEGGKATNPYDTQRAEVAVRSLIAIANCAAVELNRVQTRMRLARTKRLMAQILTLVGSSGVLGALALKEPTLAVITSVVTLLASVGNLLADYGERLIRPGQGDIYEAFEQASTANFRARRLADDLKLAVQHAAPAKEIQAQIASANQLAESLHDWATRMSGSR